MKPIVILAMHGSPPSDFPHEELTEFFRLHSQMEHSHGHGHTQVSDRYIELESKMRTWPRTPDNDTFYAGAHDMAIRLQEASGYEVIVGFNEFCAPSLNEAVDLAVSRGAQKMIVITPMMTRGGEHSERDIPGAIEKSRKKHPELEIIYAWPFEVADIGDLLTKQIKRFLQ